MCKRNMRNYELLAITINIGVKLGIVDFRIEVNSIIIVYRAAARHSWRSGSVEVVSLAIASSSRLYTWCRLETLRLTWACSSQPRVRIVRSKWALHTRRCTVSSYRTSQLCLNRCCQLQATDEKNAVARDGRGELASSSLQASGQRSPLHRCNVRQLLDRVRIVSVRRHIRRTRTRRSASRRSPRSSALRWGSRTATSSTLPRARRAIRSC